MNRREARKHSFMLLFQYKFQPEDIDRILEDFFEENPTGNQKDYIDNVVRGVISKKEEIDNTLTENAKGWSVERLSSVSLAALRLAVYEMLYIDDIPAPVSVNEAAALVKEFEGEEAVSFVNGLLGALQKKLG